MAQLAEHVIGNDEVPGPNPGSSSKKKESRCGSFFLCLCPQDTTSLCGKAANIVVCEHISFDRQVNNDMKTIPLQSSLADTKRGFGAAENDVARGANDVARGANDVATSCTCGK